MEDREKDGVSMVPIYHQHYSAAAAAAAAAGVKFPAFITPPAVEDAASAAATTSPEGGGGGGGNGGGGLSRLQHQFGLLQNNPELLKMKEFSYRVKKEEVDEEEEAKKVIGQDRSGSTSPPGERDFAQPCELSLLLCYYIQLKLTCLCAQ